MYIIKFQGGLGNQMFQYALYRRFKSMGKDVKADLTFYKKDISRQGGTNRDFELDKLFDIELIEANDKEIATLYALDKEIIKKAVIKRFGKKTYYKESTDSLTYHQEIFDMKQAYFEGFWQSEKYFCNISEEIKDIYTFSNAITAKRKEFVSTIDSDLMSVSIHMRFGDYTKRENVYLYGNICNKEYYLNAIRYMKEHIEHPHFYVFSDDTPKARDILDILGEDFTYSDFDTYSDTACDMAMMSHCKNHIIANSSYGWWGAWLNSNPNKIVVAPKKWLNTEKSNDVIPDRWIKI